MVTWLKIIQEKLARGLDITSMLLRYLVQRGKANQMKKVEVIYEVAEGIVERGTPEVKSLDKYLASLKANGCKVLAVVR